MAGIFDLIEALAGRPDPTAQLYARLGQSPGGPGSPAGPQPLAPPPGAPAAGPGGPAGPAPGPGGPAAAPGPPGAPGGPGAGPAGPQQPPQPQAYQSPPDLVALNAKLAGGPQQQQQQPPAPDLMQLYAQMAQRQQANEMFNRGLGGLTAAFSPLSQRASLEHEWDNMTADPGSVFSNIMKIQEYGQQQQQYQALQRAAPDLAKQLRMTTDEITAAGPQALQTAMQMNMPTEATRNYLQARNMMRQQGLNDDQINQIMPPETMALAGISDPNYRQYILERGRAMQGAGGPPVGAPPRPSPMTASAPISPSAPGGAGQGSQASPIQPTVGSAPGAPTAAPGGPVTAQPGAPPQSGLANPATAAGAAPNAATDDYPTWLAKKNAQVASIGEIAKDRTQAKIALPGVSDQLDKTDQLIDRIANNPALGDVVGTAYPTTGTLASKFRTGAQLDAATDIDTLNKMVFSEGFKTGGGSRKTQQELNTLQGALGQGVQATYLPRDEYVKRLRLLQDQTRTTRANSYGEAGDFSAMPSQLNGYVDPMYRPGGALAVSNAPALKQLTPGQLTSIRARIAQEGSQGITSQLKQNGYDTAGL
jgi:hypothetical protein